MRQFFNETTNLKNKQFHYRIADSVYRSHVKIPELGFLSVDISSGDTCYISTHKHNLLTINSGKKKTTYNELATVGEKDFFLQTFYYENYSYELQTQDNHFQINKNTIRNLKTYDSNIILLLGPALILNLALNNIFCLHASSFAINNTLFILMAKSGTGKSTIARFMNRKANCKRVTDDILPLKWNDSQLVALPLFPQLKLQQNKQFTGSLSFKTIKLLYAHKSNKPTTLTPLDSSSSLKKIISHTVASKLFSENELFKHLDFCFNASHYANSFSLAYSHTSNSLEELYGLLNEHA